MSWFENEGNEIVADETSRDPQGARLRSSHAGNTYPYMFV